MRIAKRMLWASALFVSACSNVVVQDGTPPVGTGVAVARDGGAPTTSGGAEKWRGKRSEVLRTFAIRALERDLVGEAKNYLEEACQLDPQDARSHTMLARLLLAEDDARAALVYAQQAARTAPNDPDTRLVYAAALAENDQEEAAHRTLEEGMALDPTPEMTLAVITEYEASGHSDLARKLADSMLAEHPEDARSWAMSGDLLLAQGELDAAATAYAEALARDPKIPTPRALDRRLGIHPESDPVLQQALDAERAGDLPAAERLYHFLSVSHPGRHAVESGLARVLYGSHRYDEAQAAVARIAAKELDWRDRLLIAKLAIRAQSWEEAESALRAALAERPGLRAARLLLDYVQGQITPSGSERRDDSRATAAAED